MVKLNSQRTPHETHKAIKNYLEAGGFEEESRMRVYSDGERMIITFFDEPSNEWRYTEVKQLDSSYGVDDINAGR